MMSMQKETYSLPECRVVELCLEGMIAISPGSYNPPFGDSEQEL